MSGATDQKSGFQRSDDGQQIATNGVRGGSTTEQLSKEEIFELLSNRRRRYVLYYLKQLDEGETVTLSEVASRVAAWETGTDPAEVSYDDRKSVQTTLYQFHLPKLADSGVVRYDKRSGEITKTESTSTFDFYLEAVPEADIPWSLYLLGLSAVVTVIAVVQLVSGQLPGSVADWYLLTVLVFLVTSSVFAYRQRFEMYLDTRETSVPVEE